MSRSTRGARSRSLTFSKKIRITCSSWLSSLTSNKHNSSSLMRQSKTKPGFRHCRSTTATSIKKALRTGIPMLISKSRQKRSLLIILCWSRPRFLSQVLWTRDPLNKPLHLRERSIYLPIASSWLIKKLRRSITVAIYLPWKNFRLWKLYPNEQSSLRRRFIVRDKIPSRNKLNKNWNAKRIYRKISIRHERSWLRYKSSLNCKSNY